MHQLSVNHDSPNHAGNVLLSQVIAEDLVNLGQSRFELSDAISWVPKHSANSAATAPRPVSRTEALGSRRGAGL